MIVRPWRPGAVAPADTSVQPRIRARGDRAIALGIGINTALFSLLNSVAWRSLPVPDGEALVSIYQDFRGGPRRLVNGACALFSIPEYRMNTVTADFFPLLGMPIVRGRVFANDEIDAVMIRSRSSAHHS